MKLLNPDQVDKTKDAYKGDVPPEGAPDPDAIAAPLGELAGDAVPARAKARAKSAKGPAPAAKPKKAKAGSNAAPPAAGTSTPRAKPAAAKEKQKEKAKAEPKLTADAAAQWDGSRREYIRRLLRTDQIGDMGILVASAAPAPVAETPATATVPMTEAPVFEPIEAPSAPEAAAPLAAEVAAPPAKAPPRPAKQAAPRRTAKAKTTPITAPQQPAPAAKAPSGRPARPAAKTPAPKARPAVRPVTAPLIAPELEPVTPVAAATPSPELIDRLQALGVQPRPGASAPTAATGAASEADQDLLAGVLALLLFLALVVGIYFAISSLFGGDEEPPQQAERAAMRPAPAPRPPPVEDRGPTRMPWSQPPPGVSDPWSYQGGAPSGSGLSTTSRMPGARLERPGDPPPGSSSGQPYYQYGTSPYGTRTAPY